MKVHKIEPIYLNDYWKEYNGISKHYARRARLEELKTLRKLKEANELKALPTESGNDCKQGSELQRAGKGRTSD